MSLTANNIPVTKSGGSSPTLQNSDITDVVGSSISVGVPIYMIGGNVGIGTSSPATTLEVIGNLQVTKNNNPNIYLNDTEPSGIKYLIGSGAYSVGVLTIADVTNSLQTFNMYSGDIYTNAWADYSASSTYTGFGTNGSGLSSKSIYTKKIGKTVFFNVYLSGTSSGSGQITFTMPFVTASNLGGNGILFTTLIFTNGSYAVGIASMGNGGTIMSCSASVAGGNFTNGTTSIQFVGWYQSA